MSPAYFLQRSHCVVPNKGTTGHSLTICRAMNPGTKKRWANYNDLTATEPWNHG